MAENYIPARRANFAIQIVQEVLRAMMGDRKFGFAGPVFRFEAICADRVFHETLLPIVRCGPASRREKQWPVKDAWRDRAGRPRWLRIAVPSGYPAL